jgi:large conductance mechanosensitive channel
MSLIREFREFAIKGNVVDLAVGVIIGAAFGKIVASLVEDIVMPLIGSVGRVDFKSLMWQVGDAKILYGKFIQTCVDFGIIAFSIFVAVKVINYLRKLEEHKPPAATPPRQEQLLEEIRDLLKKK